MKSFKLIRAYCAFEKFLFVRDEKVVPIVTDSKKSTKSFILKEAVSNFEINILRTRFF